MRFPRPEIKPLLVGLAALLIGPLAMAGETLPFDRENINRYSLDHLPRSLSIRQGKDVWLGYDLGRGKLYKVWQALAGKPGLTTSGFITRSVGTPWYEDQSGETWSLRTGEKTVPLTVRYLGCSQREGFFELSWELRHDGGALKLQERISMTAAPAGDRVTRELRVESLGAGESLLPPPAAREVWKLNSQPAAALAGRDWHRLTLP